MRYLSFLLLLHFNALTQPQPTSTTTKRAVHVRKLHLKSDFYYSNIKKIKNASIIAYFSCFFLCLAFYTGAASRVIELHLCEFKAPYINNVRAAKKE